ncbi:MAG: hypothetical protein FWE53_01875 [Firmicutes bacterium]|nr:hypothetical protein [Bacillota bacterium]
MEKEENELDASAMQNELLSLAAKDFAGVEIAIPVYNKNGNLNWPQNMFGPDPKYAAEVRENLKKYGRLVEGSPELEEYFISILENWRPDDSRRGFHGEGASEAYDNARDEGLVTDGETSAFAATYILKFITENKVNPEFVQDIFTQIWEDSVMLLDYKTDELKRTIGIRGRFLGEDSDAVAPMQRMLDNIKKDWEDDLLEVARQLFGAENPAYDHTRLESLHLYNVARQKGWRTPEGSVEDKLSKLVLTFCKNTVVYWSAPENISRIPVEDRDMLLDCIHYLKDPVRDFKPEEYSRNLPAIVSNSNLPSAAQSFAVVQKNLNAVNVKTLDGDYVSKWAKAGEISRYYGLRTQVKMSKLMTDEAATGFLLELLKDEDRDGECDVHEQLVERASDPAIRLEHLKKSYGFGYDFKGIDEAYAVLAYDVKAGKYSTEEILGMSEAEQQVVLAILERNAHRMNQDGTDRLQDLKNIINHNNTPLENVKTPFGGKVLKAYITTLGEYGGYDDLLDAIDLALESGTKEVSAKLMKSKVVSVGSYHRSKIDKAKAKGEEISEYHTEHLARLQPYVDKLSEMVKAEWYASNLPPKEPEDKTKQHGE